MEGEIDGRTCLLLRVGIALQRTHLDITYEAVPSSQSLLSAFRTCSSRLVKKSVFLTTTYCLVYVVTRNQEIACRHKTNSRHTPTLRHTHPRPSPHPSFTATAIYHPSHQVAPFHLTEKVYIIPRLGTRLHLSTPATKAAPDRRCECATTRTQPEQKLVRTRPS